MTKSDKVYDAFHNKYFHGPTWLNINALQMAESDDTKEIVNFSPADLYDIYYKDELDYGTPVHHCVTIYEMADIFDSNRKCLFPILKGKLETKKGKFFDIDRLYQFVQIGRTSAEYIFSKPGERLVFHTMAAINKHFGVRWSGLIGHVANGGTFRGYTVTKQYVRLNMDEEVVEVIG